MSLTPDLDAKTKQRDELVSMTRTELKSLSAFAEILVDRFASISAPQYPPMQMDLITVRQGGRKGGQTRKPGNIRLNWRKLLCETPDFVLTGAGSIDHPWLIPLAALSILTKLWAHARVELTKEQATCLVAMWHRCDNTHRIAFNKAYESSIELFSVYKWPAITLEQFSAILLDLEQLRCLKNTKNSSIWLREWVCKTYS